MNLHMHTLCGNILKRWRTGLCLVLTQMEPCTSNHRAGLHLLTIELQSRGGGNIFINNYKMYRNTDIFVLNLITKYNN